MGFLSKITTVAVGYAIYKIIIDDDYESFRNLIKDSFNQLKPLMLNLIDSYELSHFGARHVDMTMNKIDVEQQLGIIKKAINDLDANEIAQTTVKTAKIVQDKFKSK